MSGGEGAGGMAPSRELGEAAAQRRRAAAKAGRPTPLGVGNKYYVYCLAFLFDYNSYI
jgi:hypothetical protein